MATPPPTPPPPAATASLLKSAILTVFNQRDPALRLSYINQLFVAYPISYSHSSTFHGREALNAHISDLQSRFPPHWTFTTDGVVKTSLDRGMMRWRFGPRTNGERGIVFGTHVVTVQEGRIAQFWIIVEK
ncbi:MAG: hypothetical protein L6R42_009763 [Xanthoria sp. 1 TBL-2021]|nr:MAG: hypothetical protein L6R42_009763 [Xanthoria sp. 1 TBL-2021]